MKCPKCGFNSFEFLENCKKCGTDLASFKRSHSISPIVYAQGAQLADVNQKPATYVAREEVPLNAVTPAPSDNDAENSFTWDIPALNETTEEADKTFSGFDLEFMKDEEKPNETEDDFVFNEEPVAESPTISQQETAITSEEFSFYEETLDPVEKPVFSVTEDSSLESENDPFGETGVMGEISPETLQSAYRDPDLSGSVKDVLLEQQTYENEFVLEELAEDDEEIGTVDKEVSNDPGNFSDFEKDFESIFQTDEPSDNDKTVN
jgi:hypothetical protein